MRPPVDVSRRQALLASDATVSSAVASDVTHSVPAAPVPLYRRVLGEEFDRLAPVLRRFHAEPTGGAAQGTFAVEHGRGFVASEVATV
jgi:hypothetical protein